MMTTEITLKGVRSFPFGRSSWSRKLNVLPLCGGILETDAGAAISIGIQPRDEAHPVLFDEGRAATVA